MKGDWDPAPSERTYYRNAQTGDAGWMVKRGGVEHVKLDRPMVDHAIVYVPEHWTVDRAPVPLTIAQVGQIAFEAHKKLCYYTGYMDESRWNWSKDLTEEERLTFIKEGPEGEIAQRLFIAIQMALSPYAR